MDLGHSSSTNNGKIFTFIFKYFIFKTIITNSMNEKFKFIQERFKNFIINFCDDNKCYLYRENLKQMIYFRKENLQIFLEDVEIFDRKLYKAIKFQPLGCLKLFEIFVSKIISKVRRSNNETNLKISEYQIFLIYRNFKKKERGQTGKLVSFRMYIDHVGKNKMTMTKYDNFFIDISQKKDTYDTAVFADEISLKKRDFQDIQFVKARILQEADFYNKILKDEILLLKNRLIGVLKEGEIYQITGFYRKNLFSKNHFEMINKIKKNLCIEVLGVYKDVTFDNKAGYSPKILNNVHFLQFAHTRKIYQWIFSMILSEFNGFDYVKKGIACQLFGLTGDDIVHRKQLNILIIGKKKEFFSRFSSLFHELSKKKNTVIKIENFLRENYLNTNFNNLTKNFLEQIIFLDIGGSSLIYIQNFDKLNSRDKVFLFTILDHKKKTFKIKNHLKQNLNFSLICNIEQAEAVSKGVSNRPISSNEAVIFDLVYIIKDSDYENFDNRVTNETFNKFNYEKSSLKDKKDSFKSKSMNLFRIYLDLAIANFKPVLTLKSEKTIKNAYFLMKIEEKKKVFYNDEKFSIPLKKLETLIKISEALCRMRLSNHVNIDDVFESVKIFKEGTMGYF